MAMRYSDETRADDPHALPDVETFESHYCTECGALTDPNGSHGHVDPCEMEGDVLRGWFWQACFPGCLPDGDPIGPFATEAEALADARESA